MKKVFQGHQKKESHPEQRADQGVTEKKEDQKKDLSKKPDEESPNKGKRNFSKKGLGV